MRIKGNPKIVDEVLKPYLKRLPTVDALAYIGWMACKDAIEKGSYKNHTYNLRNANGYAVVVNGEIVKQEIVGDNLHEDAIKATEALLATTRGKADGLYLANGMFYAGFVEAKNFNVLIESATEAENLYKKLQTGELTWRD
jgi:hypothetical protein